jgi:hypothetical protein
MLDEPQDTLRLDMSRVPPGNNWWDSIERRRYGCVRWTGPGCSANLYLPLKPGSKRIRLTVVGAAGKDVLRSLRLVVEGKEVPLSGRSILRRYPRVFTGTIPAAAIQDGRRTKLTLVVSKTRGIKGGLRRKCGICVSGLEISPVQSAAGKARFAWWRSEAA